jgi:hypothetical protein
LKFNDWVDVVGGIENAAKVLEEKPRTVLAWYRGEKAPRILAGENIVTKTKGQVDFNGLYGPLAQRAAKEKIKCS